MSVGLHISLPTVAMVHPTTTAPSNTGATPAIAASTQSTLASIQNTLSPDPLAIHSPSTGLVTFPGIRSISQKACGQSEVVANCRDDLVVDTYESDRVSPGCISRLSIQTLSLQLGFLSYLAITTADSRPTSLIIREAQQHGGLGWLEYNCTFQQEAALEPLTHVNSTEPMASMVSILHLVSWSLSHQVAVMSLTFPCLKAIYQVHSTYLHIMEWMYLHVPRIFARMFNLPNTKPYNVPSQLKLGRPCHIRARCCHA